MYITLNFSNFHSIYIYDVASFVRTKDLVVVGAATELEISMKGGRFPSAFEPVEDC